MGEYMRTLLNGLKAWVAGEINRLRAKIEAVATAASKTASLAAKNKKDIALLNQDMYGAWGVANSAFSAADTAKSTADTAKSTADTAKSTADTAKSTADTAKSTADKAVLFSAAQSLTDSQKKTARDNIGGGTSNFSGSYMDLQDIFVGIAQNPLSTSPPIERWVPGTDQQKGNYYIGTTIGEIYMISSDSIIKYNDHLYAGGQLWIKNRNLPFWGNVGLLADAYPDVDIAQESYLWWFNGTGNVSRSQFGIPVLANGDFCYVVTGDATVNAAFGLPEDTRALFVSKTARAQEKMVIYTTPYFNILNLPENLIPPNIQRRGNDLFVKSSTTGSRKWFVINVDDTGTLTTTEVTS